MGPVGERAPHLFLLHYPFKLGSENEGGISSNASFNIVNCASTFSGISPAGHEWETLSSRGERPPALFQLLEVPILLGSWSLHPTSASVLESPSLILWPPSYKDPCDEPPEGDLG